MSDDRHKVTPLQDDVDGEDVFSASTVVGQASPEVLALVRQQDSAKTPVAAQIGAGPGADAPAVKSPATLGADRPSQAETEADTARPPPIARPGARDERSSGDARAGLSPPVAVLLLFALIAATLFLLTR